jgi:hypothetical protein
MTISLCLGYTSRTSTCRYKQLLAVNQVTQVDEGCGCDERLDGFRKSCTEGGVEHPGGHRELVRLPQSNKQAQFAEGPNQLDFSPKEGMVKVVDSKFRR